MGWLRCLMIVLSLAWGMLNANAQITSPPRPYSVYSTGATNVNVALSYAIIGNNSINGGTPVVTSLDATSDTSTAKVQFYKVTATAAVQYTNSTVTLFVNTTNGFNSSSGVIIIKHILDDTYEKRILTASGQSAATNLVTTVAPWGTTVPGDILYQCTTAGAGSIGLVTNSAAANSFRQSLQGNNIYSGQPGLPLLLEVDQTTTLGNVRLVTAGFVP